MRERGGRRGGGGRSHLSLGAHGGVLRREYRAAAARCFIMKQKGVGGSGGRERTGERSSPCTAARGHRRLCKPYGSAHYLAARRLSNNIMVQRGP